MARKFVNSSTHPVDVSGGGIVSPGQTIDLDEVDEHAQAMVDSGLLIEVEAPDPKAKGGKN